MHSKTAGITLLAFAAAAFAQKPAAQDAERVFYLTHTETAQQIQEIATVVRAVADALQIGVVPEQKALRVQGTDNQIRIAEWLVNELNRPVAEQSPPPLPNSAPHEYRVPGTADDVVRVFYLTNTRNPKEMQEIAVTVRSVADIPRLFIYNTLKAMAVRGGEGQVAVAEWLINELNKTAPTGVPAPQAQTVAHRFVAPGSSGQVVGVFYLRHVEKPQEMQEIAVALRSVADIPRLFIYNTLKAISARGSAEQMATAEWLVNELNKPIPTEAPAPQAPTVAHQFAVPGASDQVVRVFYLSHVEKSQQLEQVAVAVRSTANIKQLFINNRLKALSTRGTADQTASAERLVKEFDEPR